MSKQNQKSSDNNVVYKSSNYNHFYKSDAGYILAYNAFSNSFARVTPNNFEKIKLILDNHESVQQNQEEYEKLKKNLIHGGFLIDQCLDEFEISDGT